MQVDLNASELMAVANSYQKLAQRFRQGGVPACHEYRQAARFWRLAAHEANRCGYSTGPEAAAIAQQMDHQANREAREAREHHQAAE